MSSMDALFFAGLGLQWLDNGGYQVSLEAGCYVGLSSPLIFSLYIVLRGAPMLWCEREGVLRATPVASSQSFKFTKMAEYSIEKLLQSVIMYKDKYPLPVVTNDGFMEEFENMELREDDIFVVTWPKSGTHWMQEIVNLILVDGHVEKLNSSHRKIVIELADVASLKPEAVAEAGPMLRQTKGDPSPRVLATHVPFQILPNQLREKRCKLIYVYRNPKDAIVSYYHFTLKFADMEEGYPVPRTPQQFERFFDAVVPGKFEYGSWFDHVIGYYQLRHDDNFVAVSYEGMKTNLRGVIKRIASFIGRDLHEDALNRVVEGASFQTMKESYKKDSIRNKEMGKNVVDANIFVYKGQTSQWKEYFTSEQDERFDKLFKERMTNCEWTVPYGPKNL